MNNKIEKSMFKPLFEAGNIGQLERMESYHNIKTGWDDFDLGQSSSGVRRNAVKIFEAYSIYENTKKVLKENDSLINKDDLLNSLIRLSRKAADAANYSHMLILKCNIEIELLKKQPSGN